MVLGFLLYQGPQFFNWLPDKALAEGTTAEVESLIMRHVKEYREIGRKDR